jgi:hypothetical protein
MNILQMKYRQVSGTNLMERKRLSNPSCLEVVLMEATGMIVVVVEELTEEEKTGGGKMCRFIAIQTFSNR